jgi:threonine synthase
MERRCSSRRFKQPGRVRGALAVPFAQRCTRCGAEQGAEKMANRCPNCGGTVTVRYDYALVGESMSRRSLERRGRSLWRYAELLPLVDRRNAVTMGEGGTPLVASRRVGERVGLRALRFKDETRLPTGSLKDRCATVSVSKAAEAGVRDVVVSSSGNGASAVAAYAARAGVGCHVYVPADAAGNKLIQSMAYGAEVVKVSGGTTGAVEVADRVSKERGWPNLSTAAVYNPYSLQGQKTGAFEIAEELGWVSPDWVVLPVGSGNVLAGEWAGFCDLLQLGLVDRRPKLAAVQAAGCAPFADAIRGGLEAKDVKPWRNPETIAGGVRDEYPYDLELAMPALRESGGTAVKVTDQEILQAMRSLARDEGLFVEPTGAVATAGLRRLVEEGEIDGDETVVALLTGSGLKDPRRFGELS